MEKCITDLVLKEQYKTFKQPKSIENYWGCDNQQKIYPTRLTCIDSMYFHIQVLKCIYNNGSISLKLFNFDSKYAGRSFTVFVFKEQKCQYLPNQVIYVNGNKNRLPNSSSLSHDIHDKSFIYHVFITRHADDNQTAQLDRDITTQTTRGITCGRRHSSTSWVTPMSSLPNHHGSPAVSKQRLGPS